MTNSLRGKRIVVTGASSGVGAALARLLVEEGAQVALLGRRADRLERIAEASQGSAVALPTDVGDPDQVAEAFRRIDAEWGGLDALVNNAAVPANNMFNTPVDAWRGIFEVNLLGYLYCAREAAIRMKDGGGHVVNVGSLCIRVLDNGCDLYVASKVGVQGFTDSFRKEVAPDDIAVTLVNPGQIASEMVTEGDAEIEEAIRQEGMLTPEEVAETIAYCLSRPRSTVVTEIELRPRGQSVL